MTNLLQKPRISLKYINIIIFFSFLLFFILASPNHVFLDPRNLQALIRLIPEFAIVTLGIGLLLISGEIDLSISSIIPMCAYIFTLLIMTGVSAFFILITVLCVGLVIGLLNGLITTKGRIPSFITTLGTMMLLKGILYPLSGMTTIGIGKYLAKEPFLVKVFVGEVFGVPAQFLWFILFALILGLLLHFHKFGSWIYATGDNKEAARAMGINTDLVKIICFMIVGFLCAFSSIIQVIRVGAFNVVLGTFYELQAIAACVMGGVSLFGGRGGVIGILLGSFLIPIIQNGMVFVGINPAGTTAFIGMAIIIFALLNILMERGWR